MAKKGKVPDWLDDDDLFDDDDGGLESAPAPKKKEKVLSRSGSGRESRGRDADVIDEDDLEDRPAKPSLAARLAIHQKRPGEQEIAKSPLVIALFFGIVILVIMAVTYTFIIDRDVVTRLMKQIDEDIAQQRYSQAIKSLEEFLLNNPGHAAAEDARYKLGKVRIDQQIAGGLPEWGKGLEQVNKFIDDCRDLPKFNEQQELLFNYSKDIALGSLKTAAKTFDRELLETSKEAVLLIDRFANEDEPPTALKEQIELERKRSVDAIRKHEFTQASYTDIERYIKAKQPIPALATRRKLIDQYPDLERDRKLVRYMEQILDTERGLVVLEKEGVGRQAAKDDRPLPVPAPLSLTLHTRARTDEAAGERRVFAVAQGCLYGVDQVTGDPVWRRGIGSDTPFFPLEVETLVQGLLVFDTTYQELVLLDRNTGKLAWRQPLEEPMSGAPLVEGNTIYAPTLGNHLYAVELSTGKILSRLTFSQPVYSPPVLLRNGENLVVAGDEAVSYVLGRDDNDDFVCLQVWYTGQSPATIDVPLMPMGDLILMAVNEDTNSCLLRVFSTADPLAGLPEVGTVKLSGPVRDTPILRGNRLFVSTVGEQFNAFTVSDDPDQEPLLPIAQPPNTTEYDGQVHLKAGADGRMWSASDSLRRFQLTQDALLEDQQKKMFIGGSAQPLQGVGSTLFVGRHLLEADAVALTHVEGEEMASEWKTVLGSGLLAMSKLSEENILCMTKSGDVFQVSTTEIAAGGFRFRAEGQVPLPEGLDTPLHACVLPDKRIAVVCGGKTPQMWLVNQAGKVAGNFSIEAAPIAAPVPIAGGAVAIQPAKISLLGRRGSPVEDFLGTVEQADQVQWSSVVGLDENHVLLVDLKGTVTRLQFRTAPSAHLQAVDNIALGQPLDVLPLVNGEQIILTDASGKLQVVNVVGFERTGETQLPSPAIGTLGAVGNLVLVQSDDGKLRALDSTQELQEKWSVDLANDVISDHPLSHNGVIMLATMNGQVKVVNPETGEVSKSAQLDQPIEHGPFTIGPHVVVATIDGSLYRVESLLGGEE